MQITITGRHFEVTEVLREHVESKLHKLERYLQKVSEIHVILSVEKHRYIAEITFQMNGIPIRSLEETHDMYLSIDTAIDKVEKQLKRQKQIRTERKTRAITKDSDLFSSSVLNDEEQRIGDIAASPHPKIIRSKPSLGKPMSVDEAAMQFSLIPDDFLAFINSETGQLNVLYKRKDGNYGLIEPEF